MSNQIVISSGAKVRSLEGVLTGTAGIVNSVPLGGANGVATLDSNGKVPLSQLPASVVTYLGTWNATTNTPTLTNGVGDVGDLYICNVAGTVNFGAGPITFAVGDWVIYNGSQWQKSAGSSGTVTSVAVTESGDALTITGSPITTSGTINIGFAGTSTQYIAGNGTLVTFPSIISEAQNLVTEVYNNSGATIAKGSVVYINGGQGNLPTITKAQADTEVASNQTIGLVRTDITNMNNGYVTVAGRLENLDTQAYSVGTTLYLSPSVAGGYTSTKPTSPDHIVYVGIIVRSHPTQGVIEVKIQNTQELAESSDVLITSPANNEGLFYDGATSLWKNKTIANVLGYTPANDALVVHLAGTETITGAKTFTGGASFTLAGGVVGFSGGIAVDKGNAITKGSTPASFSPASTTLYSALGDNNLVLRDSTNTSILQFQASSSYTYTFPAATGTLALSSDLSSYVPYTGATADVDLGTRYFKATGVQTESAFALKILTSGIAFQNGYSVMSSLAGTFSITQAVSAGNLKSMTFDFSAWATNNSYTYNLPAINGTLALLEGTQTFTGAKTFSLATNNESGIRLKNGFGASAAGYTGLGAGADQLWISVTAATHIFNFPSTTGRTYTFPAATGTIALTSNLSAYVPYTGATANLNLGSSYYVISNDITFWKGAGTGLGNIGLGRIVPLANNTTGQVNLGILESALFSNTTGSNNIALGGATMYSNTTGSNNIAIGSSANRTNATGDGNIAIGVNALYNNTVNYNIAIGAGTLYTNTTGNNNIGIGQNTLYSTTTGSQNTAIGTGSLTNQTTGINNTAYGISTGFNVTTGIQNTFIGYSAGSGITTGSHNTIIGGNVGALASNLTNNVIIADGQGNYRFQWDSNNTIIGQSGNVGIGNASPSYKLDVTGTGNFSNTLRAASSSFPIDIYGTTNNYGLRINNVQAATLLLYSSNENSSSRNWGIYTNSEVYGDFDIRQSNAKNGDMTAGANGTSRFYIKNNGFVGIGNNNPGYRLEVTGIIAGKATGNGGRFETIDSTTGANLTLNAAFNSGEPAVQTQSNSPILFCPNNAERMRITSGGSLLLETNDAGSGGTAGRLRIITNNFNGIYVGSSSAGGWRIITNALSDGGSFYHISFNANGTSNGSIISNGSTTTYATSSDYRLKEDFKDVNGLEKVSLIKVYNFKFKGTDNKMDGVIAHELQEVIPYAVTGQKDELNEDNSIKPQGVDYSLIVPVLIKAVQELSAKVSALENKS